MGFAFTSCLTASATLNSRWTDSGSRTFFFPWAQLSLAHGKRSRKTPIFSATGRNWRSSPLLVVRHFCFCLFLRAVAACFATTHCYAFALNMKQEEMEQFEFDSRSSGFSLADFVLSAIFFSFSEAGCFKHI